MWTNTVLLRRPGREIPLEKCRGHQPSGIAPPSTIFKETVRKPRIRQAPKPVTTVCSQHIIIKKKSVSGETKDREKLPAVPNSLCWRAGWKKQPTTKHIWFRGGRQEEGQGRISPKPLEARTIKTFFCARVNRQHSTSSAGKLRCQHCLLHTGFPQQRGHTTSLHRFPGPPSQHSLKPNKTYYLQLFTLGFSSCK